MPERKRIMQSERQRPPVDPPTVRIPVQRPRPVARAAIQPRRRVWPSALLIGAVVLVLLGVVATLVVVDNRESRTTTATPVADAPAPAPVPSVAEVGQTVTNGGITLTVTSARVVESIEMNESNFRPGSGYEEYTTTTPDSGGKFVMVEAHVVNNARVSIDLTCSLPIKTLLVDASERQFDAIQDLYKLRGNPECNDQLQPGFESDMTWVYTVPQSATVIGWVFTDLTEYIGNSDYTAYRLSI